MPFWRFCLAINGDRGDRRRIWVDILKSHGGYGLSAVRANEKSRCIPGQVCQAAPSVSRGVAYSCAAECRSASRHEIVPVESVGDGLKEIITGFDLRRPHDLGHPDLMPVGGLLMLLGSRSLIEAIASRRRINRHTTTCTKSYAVGDGTCSHGTKNLHAREKSCPSLVHQHVSQILIDHERKMRGRKFNQLIYRDKMAEAITTHNYPFLIVEHLGLQRVYNYLNEDVKSYTMNTGKADCIKIYKLEKVKLKNAFQNIRGRICLTSDLWSSGTSEGYICLTAHIIDHNFVLHSKIIIFSHFPLPHNEPKDGVGTSTIGTKMSEQSDDDFDDFVRKVQGNASTRTELELYLEEKMIPNKCPFHILQEWIKFSER
ncbi:hypothetical protein OROMI_023870 [Orobanche minor]